MWTGGARAGSASACARARASARSANARDALRAARSPLTATFPRPLAGLTKFNLFDVGLTGAIKAVYTRQPVADSQSGAASAPKHH